MPHGFDNTWGIVKNLGLVPSAFSLFLYLFVQVFNVIYFFSFSGSVHLHIIEEQKAFIRRVPEIPFEERKCKDLITLDILHAYCGGPVSMPAACKLNTYSCQRKFLLLYFFLLIVFCLSNVLLLPFAEMKATRQRALVRALVAAHKQKKKEGVSTSAPKVIGKGSSKGKNEGKDNYPLKKGSVILVGDKQSKKSSPPKFSHGVGKGLMTVTGPVTQGTIHCLLTHKEHVVEMVESIIKETDLDPCVEQTTEDLGASNPFDLSRAHPFLKLSFTIVHSLADGCLVFRHWCI